MVDSTTQALSYMLFSNGMTDADLPPLPPETQYLNREQDAFLDGDALYDVYQGREQYVN